MKAPKTPDQFVARAEEEMVGITEDDAGVELIPQIALVQPFDRGLGADGHEDGGRDVAVWCVEDAGAGAGDGALGEEFEGDRAGRSRFNQSRLYCGTLGS